MDFNNFFTLEYMFNSCGCNHNNYINSAVSERNAFIKANEDKILSFYCCIVEYINMYLFNQRDQLQ